MLENITASYPPAYLTTACHDFLRPNAEPMCAFLRSKGIESEWKCYGSESDKSVAHVFHVNISLPDAELCNDDTAAFFQKYI